ncbi:MAG: NAD-dependent epimerase/dehydratase family protein [Chloroflexi bacterium]|nr:NAD-dependent epimerase/dehydratase family protein [Chloroflexota bacterium]MCL5109716.1 NAD-dependent epimerase/dehydratase family protein [Chloroflexota bacterium]
MKVLVTGGAGFIGSHVAEAYAAAGHEVVVVDNLSTGKAENLPPHIRLHPVDIRSPQLAEVFAAERPEVVNHHAAQISVNFSLREPRFDAEVNVLGSLNVIDCCLRHDVRKLVYISTGGAAVGEPRYLPVDEQHPVDPLSPYGCSKHTVEHYLYLFRKSAGLDYTVLRYPNVYGPRQDPHGEAGVVAIFSGLMLRGQPVRINGTGEQERDFIHVADLARANLLAVSAAAGEMYNVGTGVGTSVNEIFRVLAACTGYAQDPVHGPALPGEVFKIYLDSSKAERELGWRATVSLEEGLAETADWFRQRLAVAG